MTSSARTDAGNAAARLSVRHLLWSKPKPHFDVPCLRCSAHSPMEPSRVNVYRRLRCHGEETAEVCPPGVSEGFRCSCCSRSLPPRKPITTTSSNEEAIRAARQREMEAVIGRRTFAEGRPKSISASLLSSTSTKSLFTSSGRTTDGGSDSISTSSRSRTPSPFKTIINSPLNPDSPDPSIVLNPDNSLAKVYGTMLQSTESLASFVCSACDTAFPPDATIYPSPTNPKEFFCQDCFPLNGGSRGLCQQCGRDVIRLKSEGGFVENSGRIWHSNCFRCEGCDRDISSRPMVDVLGRPCCEDCFDDCLNRGKSTSTRGSRNPSPASKAVGIGSPRPRPPSSASRPESAASFTSSNPGGLRKSASQPGMNGVNPVVEELARRIGATPIRRESEESGSPPKGPTSPLARGRPSSGILAPSPVLPLSDRFAALNVESPTTSRSGTQPLASSSPAPKLDLNTTPKRRIPSLVSPQAINRTSSGLLTPSSTPEQSPAGTPPIAVDSPLSSRIPSLKGLNPPSTSTPKRAAIGLGRPVGSPAASEGAITPTRIPSGASTIPPTAAAQKQSSSRTTPFKSNLPTIASSPSGSPANSISRKGKPERPSLTTTILSDEEPDERCAKCHGQLHALDGSGKIVSIPTFIPHGSNPVDYPSVEKYHDDCFSCESCGGKFAEMDGAAAFVRFEGGVRHVQVSPSLPCCITVSESPVNGCQCTPTTRIQTFKHPSYSALPKREDTPASPAAQPASSLPSRPKRVARPASMYASLPSSSSSSIPKPHFGATSTSQGNQAEPIAAPRFGSSTVCPGCKINVSPMERGIVPGPSATKWHAACLICGGKGAKRKSRDASQPGCGKKLDSGAKGDMETGQLWCRDCWDITKSSQGTSETPISSPVFPSGAQTTSRPNSSLGMPRPQSMNPGSSIDTSSPVRRAFAFPPPPKTPIPISEDEALTEFDSNGNIPGREWDSGLAGRTSPLKFASSSNTASNNFVRPQFTGLRSNSPVRRQMTGAGFEPSETEPLAIQYTGGGVPVTRQLSSRPGHGVRPRSALGSTYGRSIGSQRSTDEGRGMFLVRQLTGAAGQQDPPSE